MDLLDNAIYSQEIAKENHTQFFLYEHYLFNLNYLEDTEITQTLQDELHEIKNNF